MEGREVLLGKVVAMVMAMAIGKGNGVVGAPIGRARAGDQNGGDDGPPEATVGRAVVRPRSK